MARYDYRCRVCGNVIEVEHPMSEKPEVFCPACGELCERVFSANAISFTGSGFYNTDMRDSGSSCGSCETSHSCGGCSGGDCSTCGH